MKILLANKFYYRRGGDCIYVLNLEQLLKKHGHDVAVFAMDYPENLPTPWSRYFPSEMTKLRALSRPFGGAGVKKNFRRLLDDFDPDVVHLNNIHTQLSPAIAELARRHGARVVWTLHDYKLLCPRYDCLKDGREICEACHAGDKMPSLKNRCIKGSLPASVIGWREAVKWNCRRLEDAVDMFICPSRFMAGKMVAGGFDAAKIVNICNFIDVDKCRGAGMEKENYYCYVGRLSHEKGVETLVEAASMRGEKLILVGKGPLEEKLRARAAENVEFAGFKSWDEIKEIVGRARFSVMPSECYENNPLAAIESLCLGTPVLGARIGGIPQLTDYTFESGNAADLAARIGEMMTLEYDSGAIAEAAQTDFDSETYYRRLLDIYTGK